MKPVCDIVEYATSRLTLFWYNATTEAKLREPKAEKSSIVLTKYFFAKKTSKFNLIKKANKINLGTVEKKAVTFNIEPS